MVSLTFALPFVGGIEVGELNEEACLILAYLFLYWLDGTMQGGGGGAGFKVGKARGGKVVERVVGPIGEAFARRSRHGDMLGVCEVVKGGIQMAVTATYDGGFDAVWVFVLGARSGLVALQSPCRRDVWRKGLGDFDDLVKDVVEVVCWEGELNLGKRDGDGLVNLLCLLLRERFVAEKVQCVKRCEKYLHQDDVWVGGGGVCTHPRPPGGPAARPPARPLTFW